VKRLVLLLLLGSPFHALAQADPAVVSLQVSLDRQGFSPGAIDGKLGPQTRAALVSWQLAHGLPATAETDPANVPVRLPDAVLYTNHVVTTNDLAQLGPCPQDWRERSLQIRMSFETVLELVAEQCHSRQEFVRTLNPDITNWTAVAPGTSLVVPNVAPSAPAPVGAARLRIHLIQKFIRAYDFQGRIVAHYPCSIGAAEQKRPVGRLLVENVAPDPNYTYDPAVFPELDEVQRGYGKLIIPPGPNNPVGIAWIGLSKPGYGIHGTPHPEDIGRTESHGCFRLSNWNAARLATIIEPGTPVDVVAE